MAKEKLPHPPRESVLLGKIMLSKSVKFLLYLNEKIKKREREKVRESKKWKHEGHLQLRSKDVFVEQPFFLQMPGIQRCRNLAL